GQQPAHEREGTIRQTFATVRASAGSAATPTMKPQANSEAAGDTGGDMIASSSLSVGDVTGARVTVDEALERIAAYQDATTDPDDLDLARSNHLVQHRA